MSAASAHTENKDTKDSKDAKKSQKEICIFKNSPLFSPEKFSHIMQLATGGNNFLQINIEELVDVDETTVSKGIPDPTSKRIFYPSQKFISPVLTETMENIRTLVEGRENYKYRGYNIFTRRAIRSEFRSLTDSKENDRGNAGKAIRFFLETQWAKCIHGNNANGHGYSKIDHSDYILGNIVNNFAARYRKQPQAVCTLDDLCSQRSDGKPIGFGKAFEKNQEWYRKLAASKKKKQPTEEQVKQLLPHIPQEHVTACRKQLAEKNHVFLEYAAPSFEGYFAYHHFPNSKNELLSLCIEYLKKKYSSFVIIWHDDERKLFEAAVNVDLPPNCAIIFIKHLACEQAHPSIVGYISTFPPLQYKEEGAKTPKILLQEEYRRQYTQFQREQFFQQQHLQNAYQQALQFYQHSSQFQPSQSQSSLFQPAATSTTTTTTSSTQSTQQRQENKMSVEPPGF